MGFGLQIGMLKQANAIYRERAAQEREDELLNRQKEEERGALAFKYVMEGKAKPSLLQQDFSTMSLADIAEFKIAPDTDKLGAAFDVLGQMGYENVNTSRVEELSKQYGGLTPKIIVDNIGSIFSVTPDVDLDKNAVIQTIGDAIVKKEVTQESGDDFITQIIGAKTEEEITNIMGQFNQARSVAEDVASHWMYSGVKFRGEAATGKPVERIRNDLRTLNNLLGEEAYYNQKFGEISQFDRNAIEKFITTLDSDISTVGAELLEGPDTNGQGRMFSPDDELTNLMNFKRALQKVIRSSSAAVADVTKANLIDKEEATPTSVVQVNKSVDESSQVTYQAVDLDERYGENTYAQVSKLANLFSKGTNPDANWLMQPDNLEKWSVSKGTGRSIDEQMAIIVGAAKLYDMGAGEFVTKLPSTWNEQKLDAVVDELYRIGGGDIDNLDIGAQVDVLAPIMGRLAPYPDNNSYYMNKNARDVVGVNDNEADGLIRRYKSGMLIQELGKALIDNRVDLKAAGILRILKEISVGAEGLFRDIVTGLDDDSMSLSIAEWIGQNSGGMFVAGEDANTLLQGELAKKYKLEKTIGAIEILEFNLAIAIARSADEQGRLSNQDFEKALEQVGSGKLIRTLTTDISAIQTTMSIHKKKADSIKEIAEAVMPGNVLQSRDEAINLLTYVKMYAPLKKAMKEKYSPAVIGTGAGGKPENVAPTWKISENGTTATLGDEMFVINNKGNYVSTLDTSKVFTPEGKPFVRGTN